MAEIQPIVIQIVLAIIASSFLVTIFTTVYTDFMKKPYIVSDVSTPSSANYLVKIFNQGLEPARNLTITAAFSEPFNITAAKVFSTKTVNIIRNDSKGFSFSIPKFVQGPGEYVQLGFDTLNKNRTTSTGDLTIYSSYDQGSNLHLGSDSAAPSDFVRNYLTRTDILVILGYIIIPTIVYAVIVWKIIGWNRERGRVVRVLSIQRKLNEIKEFISSGQTRYEFYDASWLGIGRWTKYVRYLRPKDIQKIQKIVWKLDDRNNMISNLPNKSFGQRVYRLKRSIAERSVGVAPFRLTPDPHPQPSGSPMLYEESPENEVFNNIDKVNAEILALVGDAITEIIWIG